MLRVATHLVPAAIIKGSESPRAACFYKLQQLTTTSKHIKRFPAQPGAEVSKEKNIEPLKMKRLWFDVTHLFEEILNAFDWLPNQPN